MELIKFAARYNYLNELKKLVDILLKDYEKDAYLFYEKTFVVNKGEEENIYLYVNAEDQEAQLFFMSGPHKMNILNDEGEILFSEILDIDQLKQLKKKLEPKKFGMPTDVMFQFSSDKGRKKSNRRKSTKRKSKRRSYTRK